MSRSSLCRTGFCLLLLAGFGLSLPGCSKQGEGERCDYPANGSDDCDEGLVCTNLDTWRCCPPGDAPIGDSRCNATSTPMNTGGSSSTGGRSSGGSNAGGMSGGSASGGASGGGGAPDSGEGGGADTSEAGASTGGSGG